MKMPFSINKLLLPMKGHFFFFNAGTAPVQPFLSVYARQLGFSSIIVGLIYTILPIAGMLAKPLMGSIADRFMCQKIIFLVMILVTGIAFMAIYFVPELPNETRAHFACDSGVAVFDSCLDQNSIENNNMFSSDSNSTIYCDLDCALEDSHWNTVCNNWKVQKFCESHPASISIRAFVPTVRIERIAQCTYFEIESAIIDQNSYKLLCPNTESKISSACEVTNCNSSEVLNILKKVNVSDEEVEKYYQFWLFLSLMIVSWVGQAVVVSFADTICFALLKDKTSNYGRQRCFGALGWGLFSVLAGFMVDLFSDGAAKKNYLPVFCLSIIMLTVDFAVSLNIKDVQRKIPTNILRDVWKLISNIRIIVFMFWCITVGMCTGLIWNFLFWLLEDMAKEYSNNSKNWIKTLEGIVMAVQCLGGELPFFFLSGWILKRIGHVYAMSLVLLAIGIRYILYSVITNPWWVLPVELSNGLTFGLFYASMASYASIIAPPGTATTVQGLVGAVFEGVGVSLGSLFGGIMFNNFGGPLTFRFFGIAVLIVCLIHAFVQYLLQRSRDVTDILLYATPQEAISMVADDYQELQPTF